MGRYLEIFRRTPGECEKSEISQITPAALSAEKQQHEFSRLIRLFRDLERRCPSYVDPPHWQQALDDGRTFLALWSRQAEALGWTAHELFGLHPTAPSSRLDQMGLIWLLRGRPVIALTATEAVMRSHSGATLTYRKRNEPAPGSLREMGPMS
jgi:hypothetical protein